MSQSLPDDFDWISERAACSPTQAFLRLRAQVQGDITKRISLMTENEKSRYSFRITANDWQFWVVVNGQFIDKGIVFSRTIDGIDVRDAASDAVLHQGVLTLANDGQCKLKVDGKDYDFWQFRKLALEDIFFTSVAKWRP